MASSVVAFAFLVLCCVACAKAAVVALNATCNTDNTCNSSDNHFCDTNIAPSVCKIWADAACTGPGMCVTGSTCEGTVGSQTCTCTTAISTKSDKLCSPKAGYIGGDCDSKGQCTAGKGVCQGEKCICGKQGANGAVVSTNYATYTCTPPAGYIGAPCANDAECNNGKGACGKDSTCICGHSDFVTANYATYTCIPVKSDSPPTGSPVDKSGSSMLIMSTFLVTIVSSLSKMMM